MERHVYEWHRRHVFASHKRHVSECNKRHVSASHKRHVSITFSKRHVSIPELGLIRILILLYRVEGAHSILKRYLSGSQGNLATVFSEYHLLLDNQVREIKGSLNRSLQTQFTLINGADVFKLLHYKVSSVGFNRLMDEYKNGEFLYPDPDCRLQKHDQRWVPVLP